MKKFLLTAAILLGMAGMSQAEKADSYKPMEINYDNLDVDDVKQLKIATGNVVITRGTLRMHAEKAVVRQDPEGYQFVTLTGAGGKAATFRQKRDGVGDQWIEGEAERIEYSEKVELVKLFTKAKIKRLEGSKPSDEVQGEFISYDSRKEFFTVKNSETGESKPGGGRGTMVIQPTRTEPPAAAPAAPATTPNAGK
ncbi:lipopolysaccharide transport periplasmic protein LptA [Pseudoduganella violacea]|uniref:Lipopolysaccharide export system protein LptA n=1 Tax=Pseudoduganella violacea TaxID=1715466 RepID=A0A7W5FUZ7_9BURK|nr:lipopolysaccharide transport periplasmic protein LptA [Pseudoduganella violacea]MBB3120246.1 lipopolysaccharide export system protein LptA [Pseudoduganella violacea]